MQDKDMLNILKNFDSAEKGESTATSTQDTDGMKSILESFNRVSEAPMPVPAPAPMPQEPQGQPVSMNVSLNASGKNNVDDLLSLMQAAGLSGAKQLDKGDGILDIDIDGDYQPDLDINSDMSKLRSIIDQPKEEETEINGDMDEWANSPEGSEGDEEYKDARYMYKDLSGGLNREKKQFAKAQDGDNAMAVESIKARLWAALNEKKKSKKGDGNLANNYPPYDKVTRGDIIAGATGKDQQGGKKKK